MKKTIILITAFLLVVCATIYFLMQGEGKSTVPPEDIIVKAFDSSGAMGLSKEFYCWVKLDDTYDSMRTGELVKDLAHVLDVDDRENSYSFSNNGSGTYNVIQLNGVSKGSGDLVNITGRIFLNDDGDYERYLTLDVTGDFDDKCLTSIRRPVDELTEKRSIEPEINMCLTGYYEGSLDIEHLNSICKDVFISAGAKKVEGIRDNNLISISAYSPQMEEHISVNGNKINLGVALRYNSYEKRTYIWLATPVITSEY